MSLRFVMSTTGARLQASMFRRPGGVSGVTALVELVVNRQLGRSEPVSRIELIHPNDPSIRGGSSNPAAAPNRPPVNLLIGEFTSSEKLESPFDLWARLE